MAFLRQWFIQTYCPVDPLTNPETKTIPNGPGDVPDTKSSPSASLATKKGRKPSRSKTQSSWTCSSKHGDSGRLNSASRGAVMVGPEAAERAWSEDHLGVGAWLAQQLGCAQFYCVPKMTGLTQTRNPAEPAAPMGDSDLIVEAAPSENIPVSFIGAQIDALRRKTMFERFQRYTSICSFYSFLTSQAFFSGALQILFNLITPL